MLDSRIAQKRFELENNIEPVNTRDEIYRYNEDQQREILARKPWSKE